jgi:hypothetical protein
MGSGSGKSSLMRIKMSPALNAFLHCKDTVPKIGNFYNFYNFYIHISVREMFLYLAAAK